MRPEFARQTFAKFLAAKLPNDYSVKSMAHQVGMTKSYLSEIVKGSKPAPKMELQEKIVEALGIDEIDATEFYYLAAESRKEFEKNEEIRKKRTANSQSKGEFVRVQNWKRKQRMKQIIRQKR